MDNEAIQKGAPVVPREPSAPDDRPYRGFESDTRQRDLQHLKTLSIFYFILAGLSAVGAVAGVALIAVGVLFATATTDPRLGGVPPEVGYLLIGLGAFALLFRAVYAFLLFHAGRSLRQQRRWKFAFIMAIVDCVLGGLPGIVLGVFTIIVLNRPSVKELFAQGDAGYARNEDV